LRLAALGKTARPEPGDLLYRQGAAPHGVLLLLEGPVALQAGHAKTTEDWAPLALVPSHSGPVQLPALEVLWWNTQTGQLERTRLPGRELQIGENPLLQGEPGNEAAPTSLALDGPALWPWQLACALLSLTTLAGFGLWWRARRQPAIAPTSQTGPSPRTLLDDLKRACLSNEPQSTRQALDAWARQQPETLADMAARFLPLSSALDGLNGALYSETGQHWQGEDLWRAIRTLPTAQDQGASPQEPSPLPPLYPR
ncbi:MAG: hypothetical protein ACRCVD_09310, partial [Halioglobus sp.]